VEWEFRVKAAGRFKVTAEVAALARTKFQVEVGQTKLVAESPVTGDYRKFQSVELGECSLKSGVVTLRVRAVASGWEALNLRAISLQTVD